VRLVQQDDNEEALRLLDGAIARAISENENRWVLTLSHHAAFISKGSSKSGRSLLNINSAFVLKSVTVHGDFQVSDYDYTSK